MEDVGRVRVKVAACEGLCSVLRCVAGVVVRVVGVLVLARSAWFVHAVTNGDSCRVGAGPGGRCGEQPLGCVVGVPRHRGVRFGAVEPWGYPCVRLWWKWVVGWVWWHAMRCNTGLGVVGASGSEAQHVRGML